MADPVIKPILNEIAAMEHQMNSESCNDIKAPFIKYPPGVGTNVPIVDFNIPQTTAFTTYGHIAVALNKELFKDFTFKAPTNNYFDLVSGMSQDQAFQLLNPYVAAPAPVLAAYFPTPGGEVVKATYGGKTYSSVVTGAAPGMNTVPNIMNIGDNVVVPMSPAKTVMAEYATKGLRPVLINRLSNRGPITKYVVKPPVPAPRIYVIEEYTTTSYLGNYGAGKVVKTFTLLPGERTTISVRTYKDMTSTRESAQNVLDSMSNSSATELDTLMQKEQGIMEATSDTSGGSGSSFSTQSDAKNTSKSFGVNGNLNLGIFSIGGGYGKSVGETTTSSGGIADSYSYNRAGARASNVNTLNNALTKHVQQSNANRQIAINTSTTDTMRTGEEESTVRVLENVNKSRVLNFVFRQLLQEYTTVTALTNLKFAYTNGYPESFTVVDLPNLENMLLDVIKDATTGTVDANRKAVKCELFKHYCNVLNYDDITVPFIQEKSVPLGATCLPALACALPVPDSEIFYRVVKGLTTDIEIGMNTVKVPGIVLSVQKQTLQTSSTIADAMLGGGEALDCFNQKAQDAINMSDYISNIAAMQSVTDSIQTTTLNKDVVDQQVAIVTDITGGTDQATAYKKVFGKCCPTPQNTGGCGCGDC